jgi:DnaJ domain
MILNVEDLQRDFGLSRNEAETMRLRRSLYTFMNTKRSRAYTSSLAKRKQLVVDAESMHYRSLACKAAIASGALNASKRQEVVSFFNELNGLGNSQSFAQAGLKDTMIAARTQRYNSFKAKEEEKKRTKARETLRLEASVVDKKRMETRERLNIESSCHYTLLGLEREATTEEVKVAFRALSVLFHPDKCKDDDATDIFRKLREAYDVLSCAEKRAAYDAESS